jgi:hypothetical protein
LASGNSVPTVGVTMNCFRGLRTPFSFSGFGKLVSWANPLRRHGERADCSTVERSAGAARHTKALAVLDIMVDKETNL